jgi:glycosyltransferase involved in cell wall biosynthesis
MNYYIIIPAHNEAALIGLDSRIISHANATAKIVIVNDNSTDNTADIVLTFAKEHSFVTIVEKKIECHTLARK